MTVVGTISSYDLWYSHRSVVVGMELLRGQRAFTDAGDKHLNVRIRDCNPGIPNPEIPGSLTVFSLEIPGLCKTKSRDFGIEISHNVMC